MRDQYVNVICCPFSLLKGGVIGVYIHWNCNLDYGIYHCKPEYSFTNLDKPMQNKTSGFNFR